MRLHFAVPISRPSFESRYLIADRVGMRMTRDEITTPGFVKFYVRKRTGGNHRITIVFPSTTWSSSTITARGAVCYQSTGTDSTSRLVFYDDFGSDVVSSSGTFTLNASTINFNIP